MLVGRGGVERPGRGGVAVGVVTRGEATPIAAHHFGKRLITLRQRPNPEEWANRTRRRLPSCSLPPPSGGLSSCPSQTGQERERPPASRSRAARRLRAWTARAIAPGRSCSNAPLASTSKLVRAAADACASRAPCPRSRQSAEPLQRGTQARAQRRRAALPQAAHTGVRAQDVHVKYRPKPLGARAATPPGPSRRFTPRPRRTRPAQP
jgi:hypothetical protein